MADGISTTTSTSTATPGRYIKRSNRDSKLLNQDLHRTIFYEGDDDEDEKVGIEKRILTLQRLVPGGESLAIDELFEETADYILALKEQVHTMKLLANVFDRLEKEKRKLGG